MAPPAIGRDEREYGGDREYYLATAADRVFLMPSSPLDLRGLVTYQLFLRGTFDKVGAYPDMHHIGDYKTAINQLTEKGYTRAHKGVDFGVPKGTPIMAAGSGVIVDAGWNNGGYGNYVRIRHDTTYSTAYAHLSRISGGVTRGARVQQGQIIGSVGMTGLATGPHLHYEVLVHDTQVNPLSIKMPIGKKLEGRDLIAVLLWQHRARDVSKRAAGLQQRDQIAERLRPLQLG